MEWPAELIHVSDRQACHLARAYDDRAARLQGTVAARDVWAPALMIGTGGSDTGINAYSTPPARASTWPQSEPRTASARTSRGFLVATCATSNANEIGLYRGQACTRSHQTFMNSTRKGTGSLHTHRFSNRPTSSRMH